VGGAEKGRAPKAVHQRPASPGGTARRRGRYAERLAILQQIDRAILTAHRPRDLVSAALRRLRHLIPCWRIGIWVFDWERRTAELMSAEGGGLSRLPPGAGFPLDAVGPEDLAAPRRGAEPGVDDVARLGGASHVV